MRVWILQPDVVVNCAALSVPRACEVDPDAAMSINVPSSLIKWLSSLQSCPDVLLIHLSTDQGNSPLQVMIHQFMYFETILPMLTDWLPKSSL